MHQKHAGHADMHAEMILILLAVLLVSQVLLVQWKKHRPHSYHLCTLLGEFHFFIFRA
jgi:RING finger protein 121